MALWGIVEYFGISKDGIYTWNDAKSMLSIVLMVLEVQI